MSYYLIRHPPVALAADICYGRSDVALAAAPTALALRLQGIVPPHARVISSPLARCWRLAQALAPQAESDARLQELDFGDWELQPWSNVPREALDAWAADPLHFVPPGGESVCAMQERVLAIWAEMRTDQPVVWVTHGGPLRVLLGHVLQLPQAEWLSFHFPHGACAQLDGQNLLWR